MSDEIMSEYIHDNHTLARLPLLMTQEREEVFPEPVRKALDSYPAHEISWTKILAMAIDELWKDAEEIGDVWHFCGIMVARMPTPLAVGATNLVGRKVGRAEGDHMMICTMDLRHKGAWSGIFSMRDLAVTGMAMSPCPVREVKAAMTLCLEAGRQESQGSIPSEICEMTEEERTRVIKDFNRKHSRKVGGDEP
jgi:hypothetical protein